MDFNLANIVVDVSIKLLLIFSTQIIILKILNDNKYFTLNKIFGYIILIMLEPLIELVNYKTNFFSSTVFLIFVISCVSTVITKKKLGYSIFLTVISLAISYVIYFVSLIIGFFINKIIINSQNDIVNLIIILLIDIFITIKILKTNKLKYGIVSLQNNINNEYIDILILSISVGILGIGVVFYNKDRFSTKNSFFIFMIFLVLMFITIQKSLQLYYKQKMLIKDLNETKEELENKKKEIAELEAENIRISKKRHTIVHKQKSLEYKLSELLTKTEISTEDATEIKERLEKLKNDIYDEKEIIELDKTGVTIIDDMLKCMQAECQKYKIEFTLVLKGNIHYMINNLISEEELETLLADHIKDAIIAINHTENINKSILVKLGNIDGTYGIYIYDSGVEFKKEVLDNLGKKPYTTYQTEVVTGMGFMNTFDTLRKYKASLIIEEIGKTSVENYTKVLMIKFDGKNEFLVNSYKECK